jgi:hypothetical protein
MKDLSILLSRNVVTESSESHPESQTLPLTPRVSFLASQIKNLKKWRFLTFGIQVFLLELQRQFSWSLRDSYRQARTCMVDGNSSYIWVQDVQGGIPYKRALVTPNEKS